MLVLVLIMLTCVGLIAGAAITYAGTSLRTTVVYLTLRAQNADVEAAYLILMQYIKANPQWGQDLGGSCPSFSCTGSTGTVTVSMCPQTDSLIHDGDFRPVLLTLATSGKGINQSKNTTLTINGDVWSNSDIKVRGLDVKGRVSSWDDSAQNGNCASGSVTATVFKDCAANTTPTETSCRRPASPRETRCWVTRPNGVPAAAPVARSRLRRAQPGAGHVQLRFGAHERLLRIEQHDQSRCRRVLPQLPEQ